MNIAKGLAISTIAAITLSLLPVSGSSPLESVAARGVATSFIPQSRSASSQWEHLPAFGVDPVVNEGAANETGNTTRTVILEGSQEAASPGTDGTKRLIDDVNVFVGTDGFGNVYPGPQLPYGAIQISPDCDDKDYDCAAGYKYSKPYVQGFSLTHLSGTGIPDLGDFLFLPGLNGKPEYSKLDHGKEQAHPGYYGITLDSGVKAEMTAAMHSGIFMFTYPVKHGAVLMIDLDHTLKWDCEWSEVRLLDDHTVIGSKVVAGWNPGRKVFFAARFSEPIKDFTILQDGKPVIYDTKRFRSSLEAWGRKLQVLLRFDGDTSPYNDRKELATMVNAAAEAHATLGTVRGGTANGVSGGAKRSEASEGQPFQLEVKVAVSGVGTDGALLNLRELDGKDFQTVLAEAEYEWEKALGIYSLDSGDEVLRQTFYTSVYRTMLHPFVFQDTDGRFREHDGTIGKAEGFTNVTTFSFWDTFRAFEPLMNLVNRPLQADIANSMLAHFDKSAEHMLPYWSFYGGETWCMIGYHSCSVLADMIMKDVPGFDYERAFQAMKTTATNAHYDCIPEYTSLGYVPFDLEKESVSKTLEYAYDDWCIAQVAKKLGHEEDYEFFINRSMNYKNLIDPETGYMRGKDSKGAWRTPFAPIAYQGPGSVNGWGDITEGFTMQYTWSVFHDFDGYVSIAGRKRLKEYLDNLFTIELPEDIPGAHDIWGRIGGYWHGNEPCHHVTYLYDYFGEPWNCQKWVRYVAENYYGNEPGSLSGNDDCGQMSAWYIFNCLGFYPFCPAADWYYVGSPCVPAMSVTLSNGKQVKMTTKGWSKDAVYVKAAWLNGKRLSEPVIRYDDIKDGATLHFEMSRKPVKKAFK